MMRITETVKHLIIINVIFFIGMYVVGQQTAVSILGMHFPENAEFQLWQPLTYMFMHGNVMHILFNMLALFSFGGLLESVWGPKKFLFFYFSCGLGAALLHVGINYISFSGVVDTLMSSGLSKHDILLALDTRNYAIFNGRIDQETFDVLESAYNSPMIGASGAIYGILVAFAFIAPNAELMLMFIPIPIKAKYFVPGLLTVDLVLGLKGEAIFGGGDGIAHFAHLGGALVGFIMMWIWSKNQVNNNRWN